MDDLGLVSCVCFHRKLPMVRFWRRNCRFSKWPLAKFDPIHDVRSYGTRWFLKTRVLKALSTVSRQATGTQEFAPRGFGANSHSKNRRWGREVRVKRYPPAPPHTERGTSKLEEVGRHSKGVLKDAFLVLVRQIDGSYETADQYEQFAVHFHWKL